MSLAAFAALLERLIFTPTRSGKLILLQQWFAEQPDPERGYGLAALTEELRLAAARPAMIRALIADRVDAELWRLAYDYVGDLAETVALLWPEGGQASSPPALSEVITRLETAPKAEVPGLIAHWLDACDAAARLALIKLVTGGLRVGVSGRLARLALAQWAGQPVEAIEEVWHGLTPPYEALFAWLAGRTPRPLAGEELLFRPLMLAHPLEEADLSTITAARFCAEWKWDGIRVQLVANGRQKRLFSRSGEDLSAAFPEIVAAMTFDAVLDGELLVQRDGCIAPFADLQRRLNRRRVTPQLQQSFPAMVRLYDILFEGGEDLRPLPFVQRRARLEGWYRRTAPARMDLSPLIPFTEVAELARLREEARALGSEGLMLKRADAPYVAGRVKGLWWKWKRAPLTVDAVLMYAQRGHGRRSSYYSDYTFGVWAEDGSLVPIGKAYFGFTDEELRWLDRWVRRHTVARFGPVRQVEPGLVLEIACDAIQPSTRHRSGVALRFPRINRIRRDKPAAEADRLSDVLALLQQGGSD